MASDAVLEVTTCVRLLQLLLPPLLAHPPLSRSLLWLNATPSGRTEEEAAKTLPPEKENGGTPHGARLMQSLINLLFRPGYCVAKLATGELDRFGVDPGAVWAGGLQAEEAKQGKERKFDQNRCDVLYLIMECLSTQLYEEKRACGECNLFAMYASCGETPNIKNMFFSLLNTVVSYNWKGYVSR